MQDWMEIMNHWKFLIFQARAEQKTLHNGNSHINVVYYSAICLMLDTSRSPGHIVSVMMPTVELKGLQEL